MKKHTYVSVLALLLTLVFSGCGSDNDDNSPIGEEESSVTAFSADVKNAFNQDENADAISLQDEVDNSTSFDEYLEE